MPKTDSRKPKKSSSPSKPATPEVDPHAKREAQNYENPIASREHILEVLKETSEPMTHPQMAHLLGIDDAEAFEALRRRLIAMARDGQLVCNRRQQYLPSSSVSLMKGTVIGHRDGFGFVKLEKGGDDLMLSAKQMQGVFDGDRVLVRVDNVDQKGRGHAVIVEVLERNTSEVVGRIFFESGLSFIEVENVRETQQVVVPPDNAHGAKHGQYVVAKIVQQPTKREHAIGEVTEVLGDHMAPGMEIEVAVRSHNIPHEWPQDLLDQVAELKPEVREEDKLHRIDIRSLPLITIDGEDARDFDDAVYCERREQGGWRLYVAIADVSHYVENGSALDQEAHKRATSVYFPDHVIPMLPEILSNGLCSLNPKVDRLCMVCEMELDATGRVEHSYFYEAVMHSHARMTYNQVGCILDEPDSVEGIQLLEDFADRLPQIYDLYALHEVLRARRTERGAIDFETVETQIIFGEDRKIDDIVPRERNDAHKLIEECMLCANVATAEFLVREKVPALYRVHEGPGAEKLENLRAFLSELGIQLWGGETPQPEDYQRLIKEIEERPDFPVLQTMMLRSMSQAVYSPEEKGHFGLAFEHYAHFTSPIRRYPDLLVHRAIKSIIYSDRKTNYVKRPDPLAQKDYRYPYDFEKMVHLGEHCSMAERRADDATRDVTNWLKCEYLQQHLGETFEGLITAVTGFGFFVELKDLYVEGLVHVASLDGDFYQFDQQKQRLRGERTGTRYGLGDSVVVQVASINLEERKIDLILTEKPKSNRRSKRISAEPDKRREGGRGKAKVYNDGGKRNKTRKDRPADEAPTKKDKAKMRKAKGSSRKAEPLKVGEDLQAPRTPATTSKSSTHELTSKGNNKTEENASTAPNRRRRAKLHPVSDPKPSVESIDSAPKETKSKPRKRRAKPE
jgi:ribonuclease R